MLIHLFSQHLTHIKTYNTMFFTPFLHNRIHEMDTELRTLNSLYLNAFRSLAFLSTIHIANILPEPFHILVNEVAILTIQKVTDNEDIRKAGRDRYFRDLTGPSF